jgi:hypothetical protein
MARTTHRSKAGKKLYAVRDKQGRFKEIQSLQTRSRPRYQAQKQEREIGSPAIMQPYKGYSNNRSASA